jgi:hypothetical protein
MKNTSFKIAIATVGIAVLAIGCGSGNLAPVSGTVNYHGQPLKEGTIGFIPDKGRPAYGKIVDGKIVEVTTITRGDGVTVGHHKVQIQAISNASTMYAQHKSLIPDHYADPNKSGLTAEIKKGSPALTFDLQ